MNRYIKRQLTTADAFLILVNLLPVWGVWFKGWEPKEIFLVYCLESVIVGLFNIIKMWLTTLVVKKDEWSNGGTTTMTSGYFFIIFFFIHYGFFVFVQVSIFLAITSFKDLQGISNTGFFSLLFHPQKYFSNYALYLLLSFTISYGFQTLKNFILNGAYRTTSLNVLMFEPYMRIFIQQFAVIAGGFILMFGAGKVFILLFAIIKIVFEVAFDYDKVMQESLKKNFK